MMGFLRYVSLPINTNLLQFYLFFRANFSCPLQAIWPYSGHYLPTEENFKEFVSFLEEHSVDLANVKVLQYPGLKTSLFLFGMCIPMFKFL